MNAPPGVDTDTSGEDFTPPPTPPPDRTRPQFSLTSLLTATPRPRKAQRKAAETVKHQTPIEAAEDTPNQKKTTRLKKKVRIAETEQAEDLSASAPEEAAQIPALQAAIEHDPTSESSRDIIELLNRLLTQNDDAPAEDADSESSSPARSPAISDSEGSQTGLITSSGPPKTSPPPIAGSAVSPQARKQSRLKLLPTWLRSRKIALNSPIPAPEDPPTPTAFPPGSGAVGNPHDSKINGTPGQPTPWTAPLYPPASSPYNTHAQPYTAHQGMYPWHTPSTNAPWSAYQSHDNDPSGDPQRPDPTAAWEGMPNPPPWFWTGHQAPDQTSRQAPVSPPSQFPPYPPHYPHPASLRPWNPWYPSQYTAGLPTLSHPHTSPYDGIQVPEQSPPASQGPPSAPSSSSDMDPGGQGDPRGYTFGVKPAIETARTADQTNHSRNEGQTHRSAVDQVKRLAGTSHHKKKNMDDTDPDHPKDLHEKESIKPNRHKKGAMLASATAVASGSSMREGKSRSKTVSSEDTRPMRRADDAFRDAASGVASQQPDIGGNSQTDSRGLDDPNWSQCLLSMAVCINLVNTVIDKTRKRDDDSTKPSKEAALGLLTSTLAALITQRSLAGALRDTVGKDHPTAIITFTKELQTLASFLKHKAKGAGMSDKDIHQLSRLHKHASDSLQSAGTTLLLSHLAKLSFLATPKIISAILELGSDWYKGELTGKKVVNTSLLIHHEMKDHASDRRKEHASGEEGDHSWPASALKHGIDLLCKIFVPDDEHRGKQKTTHDAKSHDNGILGIIHQNRRSHGSSDHADSRHSGKGEERPHHRTPINVLSDLVHHTPGTGKHDPHDISKGKLRADPVSSKARIDGGQTKAADRSIKGHVDRKHVGGDAREPPKVTRSSSPNASPPASRVARHRDKVLKPEELVLEEPIGGVLAMPDSSPSMYSQEDIESEGTVESDEEARELLAQADSGPARKDVGRTDSYESDKPTDEQVDRAKKVVFGEKRSRKA